MPVLSADARRLVGAPREHHLHVGARLRGRRRHGAAQQGPSCHPCDAKETSNVARTHFSMLT